jgi:hypothetical protein
MMAETIPATMTSKTKEVTVNGKQRSEKLAK